MRKGLIVLLAVVMVGVFALPAMAEVSFFGTARVIPTYYNNFDFDKNKPDAPALNEGGWASGEHIRGEFRLGWQAGGDKWSVMMLAESDMIFNKNNGDRSYYSTEGINPTGNTPGQVGGANSIPNAGAEFGIERALFTYEFFPALQLVAGLPITSVDIGTGGLLYGDDHPMIGFRGKITGNIKYELIYLNIQNTPAIGLAESPLSRDWRAYYLKPDFSIGAGAVKGTLSPIVLFSDYRGNGFPVAAATARTFYYGLEGIGQFGIIKPSFEVIFADGDLRSGPGTPARDIKSRAAFAGVELAVNKAFNPYVAGRYTEGDGDKNDNRVEGFVGVTDIGRFTPLMGMDGNILGEHLSSGASPYNSPLYSYSPDRAVGGNVYGGIGGASSGNNPGQRLLAIGVKGTLDDYIKNFSYKTQAFMIWYDKTANLSKGAGKPAGKVDKYAGTTFDLQLIYAFSKNFSANYIFSMFAPGSGIKDQLASTADSTFASLHTLNLTWTY
ncbi:hypothetical protein [Candidatus Deferrimicrobium sp.]|uniref:hypothetical protein n=1 Tax=Candidatus Deferrimicrobium sp. TaxID=3060586 RepID=UPI002ED144A9